MCTVVFLRRPDHRWPLILGTNRDEMGDRPWAPPGRHWPDRPEVTAGIDLLAGGTWLGINDLGVIAGVLNRKDSLGPDPRLRSRGELVLEALDHGDAIEAAMALRDIDPRAFRSFNLFVADNRDAFWIRSLGPDGPPRAELRPIPEGISMLTAWDLDAPESARTRYFRPKFEAARPPDPTTGRWTEWEALMASREHAAETGPSEAMCVITPRGFGTLSSSLMALARPGAASPSKIWRFAGGRPDEAAYEPVALSGPGGVPGVVSG